MNKTTPNYFHVPKSCNMSVYHFSLCVCTVHTARGVSATVCVDVVRRFSVMFLCAGGLYRCRGQTDTTVTL